MQEMINNPGVIVNEDKNTYSVSLFNKIDEEGYPQVKTFPKKNKNIPLGSLADCSRRNISQVLEIATEHQVTIDYIGPWEPAEWKTILDTTPQAAPDTFIVSPFSVIGLENGELLAGKEVLVYVSRDRARVIKVLE